MGNNGVGKTTLLDLILDISNLSYKRKDTFNYILVYKYNVKIEYMCSQDLLLENNKKIYYSIDSNKDRIKDFLLIYYTNTFDNKVRYLNNKNIYDISTMNLIKEDNKNVNSKNYYKNSYIAKNEIFDFNQIFFEQEIQRQIEFMSKFNESDKCLIGFKLKSKIKIEFVDLKNILTEILDRLYLYNDHSKYISQIGRKSITGEEILQSINKTISNIYNIYSMTQENKFKLNLYLGFLLNILGLIIQDPNKNFVEESTIIKFIGKLYDELEDYNNKITNDIKENIDRLGILISDIYYIYEEFDNSKFNSKEFNNRKTNLLGRFYNLINSLSSYDIESDDKGSYYISIYKFGEFNNLYKSIMIKYEIINFSWGLSSGEYNLLSFYARLYYISEKYIKKNNSNSKDLTILIDEADLSFHPEWQRRYIKSIIGFFNTIFAQYKIQIILTTHSPILLSDIPNENVLYLSRDKNKTICTKKKQKTFGANIYNLYKDNFYFDINALKQAENFKGFMTQQIIDKVFPIRNTQKIKDRVFFTSKKTLLNEFNHFEGNMNIFQPAIDITDNALEREKELINQKLEEIIQNDLQG